MEKIFPHEFDADRKIMHLYFLDKKVVSSKKELDEHFEKNDQLFDQYKQFAPFYLVIGIGNLSIDTSLSDYYAKKASELMKKYIIPSGVARYGQVGL